MPDRRLNVGVPDLQEPVQLRFNRFGRANVYAREGIRVASIHPFVPPGIFDDAATKVMGEAFDAACKALNDKADPTLSFALAYEVIAHRIIAAAQEGERDVERLRTAALRVFGEE